MILLRVPLQYTCKFNSGEFSQRSVLIHKKTSRGILFYGDSSCFYL